MFSADLSKLKILHDLETRLDDAAGPFKSVAISEIQL